MANSTLTWVKSSYSGSQGGNCVEIAADRKGRVLVRDTKSRGGAVLGFQQGSWLRFAAEVKAEAKAGRGILGYLPVPIAGSGASSVEEGAPLVSLPALVAWLSSCLFSGISFGINIGTARLLTRSFLNVSLNTDTEGRPGRGRGGLVTSRAGYARYRNPGGCQRRHRHVRHICLHRACAGSGGPGMPAGRYCGGHPLKNTDDEQSGACDGRA